MNAKIQEAAILYCTDRTQFNQLTLSGDLDRLHTEYLNELFLNANTRPDMAETIAILTVGGTPFYEKHGYDG
ncbi:MAG: hypothetical protein ACXW2E_00295 [Nitrososphaeraceae archaeon]